MVRAACFDRYGMKKGAWSEEEDNKLRVFVLTHGHWNWRLLPKYAGLARCGKSCRLRWVNYLKPGVKRGNYTKQEEDLIIQLHAQFGTKWSIIAKYLPGRTDNDIKNFWNAHVEKRRKRKKVTDVAKEENLSSASLIPAFDSTFSEAGVDLWPDHHAGNDNDQKDCLVEEGFLSREVSCYMMSGFEWIVNDENIMSWKYVDQSLALDHTSNGYGSCDIQEEGGGFNGLSYGMHFLS